MSRPLRRAWAPPHASLLASLLAPLLLLVSCGYRSGLVPPEGYRSVGVEIFANDSKEPDLERRLHQLLSRTVRDTVEAPLVTPGEADLVVHGRITGYARFGGVRGPQNQLLETGVSIGLEAWLVDGRTGERVGEPVVSGQSVGYTTVEAIGEERSRDRSLAHLAEGLVLDLFAPHAR